MSEMDILVRLGVALLCGAAIGLEREISKHPAGLRTFAIVSLASALAMILQLHLCDTVAVDGIRADAGRIAGQVITGIGFIGAGLIMRNKDNVQGLTTAACIFLAAVIGLAVGAGMIITGIATTAAVLIVLISSQFIKRDKGPKKEQD